MYNFKKEYPLLDNETEEYSVLIYTPKNCLIYF